LKPSDIVKPPDYDVSKDKKHDEDVNTDMKDIEKKREKLREKINNINK